MYADEANGTQITSDNIPGWTVRSTIAASHIRITLAHPFGATNLIGSTFSVSSVSRGCSNSCVVFTIGYTGGNPASNTRYRILVHESGLIGGGANLQNAGNFEIRPNPTGKVVVITSTTGQPTEAGGTSTIRLRLSTAPSGNVTVAVSVSDTTEASLSTSSLTFTSTNFRTHQTVTVTGKDDSLYDGTKSYNVVFNPASTADVTYGAAPNVNVARTTTDDETAPTVTLALGSTSISENGGLTGVTASIGATDALTEADITITVRAASSSDYRLTTNKTLTIAAGQRSSSTGTGMTVTITANDNNDWSASKSVTVTGDVTAPAGVSDPSSLTLTITNDDFPTLTISSPSVSEGDSGQTSMTFTVTRSYAIAASSTVAYAEITGGTATSGTDFAALAGGTLTFASGLSATQSFTVMVNGDTTAEAYETVKVRLSSATNAVLSGGGTTLDGTGTIENDDAPTVSVNAPTVPEGDSGSVTMTFTVSLNYQFNQQVTVAYADAGNGSADSGTDYTAIPAGTLTFAAGTSTTSQTITVAVQGDTVDEPNETILVTLSSLTGGVFSGGAASITVTGTITDDETPMFSIDSPTVTEGDSGSVTMTFTVTLDLASHEQTTVNYMDAGSGTATSGTDYVAITAGTLTFDAGDTSETIHCFHYRRCNRRAWRDDCGDPEQRLDGHCNFHGDRHRQDYGQRHAGILDRLDDRDGRRQRLRYHDVHSNLESGQLPGGDSEHRRCWNRHRDLGD